MQMESNGQRTHRYNYSTYAKFKSIHSLFLDSFLKYYVIHNSVDDCNIKLCYLLSTDELLRFLLDC